MIVRNEAAVIERCLRSVLPVIDHWVICDTGSTDETPELIARVLAGIPGELHHRSWRNFGVNRTELMKLAVGKADYLLLLDADMTLSRDGLIGELTADAYLLRCGHDLAYWVPRLVRGDIEWRFTGVTHEYLDGPAGYSTERCPGLSVVHYADGGSRGDKYARDRALLEARLAEQPDDERAVFYLAQTLRDVGDREGAIALYQRRAEMGGYREEAFYAAYQAALLIAQSDPAGAIPAFCRAHELRPSRAEPLYEIARIAAGHGWHWLAHAATSRGLALPPNEDNLFVHKWMYEWGLKFEHGIASYWTGDYEGGLRVNDELLSQADLPRDVGLQAARNRDWCALRLRQAGHVIPPAPWQAARYLRPAMRQLSDLVPGARLAELHLADSGGWPVFNPSIATDAGGGFLLIARSANYERFIGDRYVPMNGDHSIRTTNYLVRLDSGLAIQDASPLADLTDGRDGPGILGAEDCRLFSWRGDWWASASRCDVGPAGTSNMVLSRLGDRCLEPAQVLAAGYGPRNEKNWMPFVADGQLHFVYSCSPFIVLCWDAARGSLTEVARRAAPALAGFHGGSQGLALAAGYLFAVHEIGYERGDRVYRHRLLLASRELEPIGLSEPFFFAHGGVEFCAGAAVSAGQLVLSFGLNDRVAALASMPLDAALSNISPITETGGPADHG